MNTGVQVFMDMFSFLLVLVKCDTGRTSLVVQWVRLRAPNAGALGSIPGQGTRSHMHAATESPCAATKTQSSQNK